jgi:dihydrofolate reductase
VRKLALRVFDYSLDGIIGEDDTDFSDFCRIVPDDPAQEDWERSFLGRAEVHIMGRVTYQGMAQYFPTATDHPYAGIMNKARKAVFSRTLSTTDWANSTILGGDLGEQIARLKSEGSGDIVAHGGVSFVQSLVRLDLVDEYRLTVFPYLAGRGRSLFAGVAESGPLELVSGAVFGNGTAGLIYRPLRRP